ncbi:MAG TPA: hypothetical protein VHJ34_02840 [Actinomycetota bacterium]|nr:hypothetical protein [Actinomycetota bacterium]
MADVLVWVHVVLVAALVGVALWGWRVVPARARVPARLGAVWGAQTTVGKGTALGTTTAMGALMLVGSIAAARQGGQVALAVASVLSTALILAAQAAMVRRAGRG